MVLYLYSNLIGCFVLNTQFRVIDSTFFSNDKIIRNSALLENQEWLPEEKSMIQKHKHKMFCLSEKRNKIEEIEHVYDSKLDQALQSVYSLPEFYRRMREAGIILAKHKIKNSVKSDTLIIQAVSNIDETDKVINILSKRLREWYELCLPEFSKKLKDNTKFAEIIPLKSRQELLKELNISKNDSMGSELSEKDMRPILRLSKEITSLSKLRESQLSYIDSIIKSEYPNFYALAGAVISAKLIRIAGSFEKLSKMAASKIQLLGAEEALFRHLKTGAKSPKYGILHEHKLVSQAGKKDKGKAARALADKISIAVKIDYFKGKYIGDKLMSGLEKRFIKK